MLDYSRARFSTTLTIYHHHHSCPPLPRLPPGLCTHRLCCQQQSGDLETVFKPSLKHDYSQLFSFLSRFHLAKTERERMTKLPQTWNLMSSFSVFFHHTECHTFSTQSGTNSAQKVRGISYPNHWISETNKTKKKFNNLWEEHDYSRWWNRAQSCHLCVSRTTAFRAEKKRKTNSLKKFYGKKNYGNIYEYNH